MSNEKTVKSWSSFIIWAFAFGYFAAYVPYSSLTKALTKGLVADTKLVGFQILPLSVIASALGMFTFITIMGWWKHATQFELGGISLPRPRLWTTLSGICTGLIIVTTTLAYTIEGVSIVFAMLMMRGGVLIMSPVVDRITGRHVRWFSWMGLLLAFAALVVAFAQPGRPGSSRFAVSAVLMVDIGIYLASYFFRLQFMSRMGKSDDPAVTKGYLAEEQMVATPSVLLLLIFTALILGGGDVVGEPTRWQLLRMGFSQIWSTPVWGWVIVLGILSQFTGIFGTLILLDRSETAFAVPVNRSSSILAGVMASFLLYFVFDLSLPSVYKMAGAGVILVAILFLSIPPLIEKKRQATQG